MKVIAIALTLLAGCTQQSAVSVLRVPERVTMDRISGEWGFGNRSAIYAVKVDKHDFIYFRDCMAADSTAMFVIHHPDCPCFSRQAEAAE